MTQSTASSAKPVFQLEPPEAITPVPADQGRGAGPLKPETVQAVDEQVGRFIEALMHEDLRSDAFRSKLNSAFTLGREEISTASTEMQNPFMQSNFAGMEDSAGYDAGTGLLRL